MSERCLVFDLDGTLMDSRLDIANAANMVRRVYGLEPLPLETVASYTGDGLMKLTERILQGTKIMPEEAYETMEDAFRANLNLTATLYPGVLPTVRALKAGGWKLTVLSNKNEDFCKACLYDLGIGGDFEYIIGASEGFPKKPDPGGLELICDLFGIRDPSASWIIGDGAQDMAAGRLAGFRRCYASYGFGDLKDETYDLKINQFSDLKEILL